MAKHAMGRHIVAQQDAAAQRGDGRDLSGGIVRVAPVMAAIDDLNSCSIGIEIINRGHDWGYPDYPTRQIAAVTALCRGILLRHDMPTHRVLGHSDVSPARKKDPGEKFPWHLLASSGVGHWVHPAPITSSEGLRTGADGDEVKALQQALARYGYGIEVTG